MHQRGRRQKGRAFEKKIAKLLGVWYYKDAKALAPTRGSIGVPGTDQCGDIGVVKSGLKPWVFSVECKKQEGWNFEELFTRSTKPPLLKFWKQCKKAAKAEGKIPLLIVRKNYCPIIVGMDHLHHATLWARASDKNRPSTDLPLVMSGDLCLTHVDFLLAATTAVGWRKLWRELNGK